MRSSKKIHRQVITTKHGESNTRIGKDKKNLMAELLPYGTRRFFRPKKGVSLFLSAYPANRRTFFGVSFREKWPPFFRSISKIPLDYRSSGCLVYGGKWIDERKIPAKDMHLFHSNNRLVENRFGYKMCVGTPESFSFMKNVLLEAVKTADNMLVAYERVQSGTSDRVILNAYSHGDIGRKEYQNDRKRYVPR